MSSGKFDDEFPFMFLDKESSLKVYLQVLYTWYIIPWP